MECACACNARERVTTFTQRGNLYKRRLFAFRQYLVMCNDCEHRVISALPDPIRTRQKVHGSIVAGLGALGILVAIIFVSVTNLQEGPLDRYVFILMIVVSASALTVGLEGAVFGNFREDDSSIPGG